MRNIITHITLIGEFFIAIAFTLFTGTLLGFIVAGLILLFSAIGLDTIVNFWKSV